MAENFNIVNNIPIGYRFQPTDEELISCYLSQKLVGNLLPALSFIVEKELYGDDANPWHVFSDRDPWVTEKTTVDHNKGMKTVKSTIYAFTKLTKIGAKRISRKAGCGLWGGQTGEKAVKSCRGHKIGSTKMLTFETKQAGVDTHGHWIMHEYCVNDRNGKRIDDYVVCKITRTSTNILAKDLEQQRKRSLVVLLEDQDEDGIGINSNKKAKMMMMVPTFDDHHDVVLETTTHDHEANSGNNIILGRRDSAINNDEQLSLDEFGNDLEQLLMDEIPRSSTICQESAAAADVNNVNHQLLSWDEFDHHDVSPAMQQTTHDEEVNSGNDTILGRQDCPITNIVDGYNLDEFVGYDLLMDGIPPSTCQAANVNNDVDQPHEFDHDVSPAIHDEVNSGSPVAWDVNNIVDGYNLDEFVGYDLVMDEIPPSIRAANVDQPLSWDDYDFGFDLQALLVDETTPTLQEFFAAPEVFGGIH